MSNYGKVKSFRLDKKDEKLLKECFDVLNITGGNFNRKMVTFIKDSHARLNEIRGLQEKVDIQRKEIVLLKKQIPPVPVTPAVMEKPIKVKPVTPTQITQKPVVTKEQFKEIEKPRTTREQVKFSPDGMSVLCKGIYYNNWIGKEICVLCQDKECEIKKGTVTFPKQKPKNQILYPLKRW
jgi:hypothetical protein